MDTNHFFDCQNEAVREFIFEIEEEIIQYTKINLELLRLKHLRYQKKYQIQEGTLLFESIFFANLSPIARARQIKDKSWAQVK